MFLSQDVLAFERQAIGFRYKPSVMLVGDVDMPAKWYYKLKAAHLASVKPDSLSTIRSKNESRCAGRVNSETGKTCATGATREDETSDPSRFSHKSHEPRANNEIRFTRNALSGGVATNRQNHAG